MLPQQAGEAAAVASPVGGLRPTARPDTAVQAGLRIMMEVVGGRWKLVVITHKSPRHSPPHEEGRPELLLDGGGRG